MKIINTKIKDLVLLKTNIYKDNRGFFKEVEKSKILKTKFVFDCFSYSKKKTLRGLHLQKNKSQAKIDATNSIRSLKSLPNSSLEKATTKRGPKYNIPFQRPR